MRVNKFGRTFSGDPFNLPADVATQKIAFLARSGAGKTYAATKLAELLHASKAQFVVLLGEVACFITEHNQAVQPGVGFDPQQTEVLPAGAVRWRCQQK